MKEEMSGRKQFFLKRLIKNRNTNGVMMFSFFFENFREETTTFYGMHFIGRVFFWFFRRSD
jgi:hypothetical protein